MKILFLKRTICPEQPINWKGEHLLECTHSFNRRSKKYYLMYCDVLKKMPNARLKIRVYGRLYNSIQGERIRYVDSDQVCSADKWNISKNEGKHTMNKHDLNNVDALIGKKYYQLSYDEKLIIADIFKTGRKLGMKLVVNLPKNSDEALIQSLKNGIWGIYEMEHTDAQGIEVQIERI